MATPAASGNGGTSAEPGALILAGRWRIDDEAPLPAFNRPSAHAFAASELQAPDQQLLALVCTSGLPFRAEPARLLAGASIEGLLRLIAFGIVDWPAEQARLPALIYERPLGGPVAPLFGPRGNAPAGDDTARRLIRPIVRGLRELQRMDIAHRAIRPENLWLRDATDDTPVLGCGLSGPAGWDQPSAFEPVERAMAEPAGRGEGDIAADIYALGVSVLWLVTGPPPWATLPEADILSARVDRGSYPVLTQGVQVPEWLVEPLRGMLADDPERRWSLRDVQTWLEGARPPMRIAPPRPTPEAPFTFAGRKFDNLRALAMAMARDVPGAARLVRGGLLQNWLRHALHDPIRAKRIDGFAEGSKHKAGDTSSSGDDVLVARTLLVLDQQAPVRYRDAAFSIDGFGPLLARRALDGGSMQALAQAVVLGLPKLWLAQSDAAAEVVTRRARRLAACAQYLRDPRIGFGVERCLYAENPGLPCLSPPLRASAVLDLDDLLPGLEKAAAAVAEDKLFDRHVAGFAAARVGEGADDLVADMSSADPAVSAAATLGLLALVQRRHPDAWRPRLAKWIGRKLAAAISAVRHRPTRVALEREAGRLVAKGDLCALHALINDPERRHREEGAFHAAASAWKRAEFEMATLARLQPQRQLAAQVRGARVAAMIALSAALLSVGFTILFTAG